LRIFITRHTTGEPDDLLFRTQLLVFNLVAQKLPEQVILHDPVKIVLMADGVSPV
jgi:hypothetical protein